MNRTIIIGGGVAGLYAAYLFAKQGKDYLLLEATNELGGRAKGVAATGSHQLELGATWFWAEIQPELTALFAELGVSTFDQPTDKLLVEARANERARAYDYLMWTGNVSQAECRHWFRRWLLN